MKSKEKHALPCEIRGLDCICDVEHIPHRESVAFQIGYRQATRESVAFIRTWKVDHPKAINQSLGEAYFNLLFEGMATQLKQTLENNLAKIGGNR